jgi:hypothetical protein
MGNAVNTWHFQRQIILDGLKKGGELPWWETHCLDVVFRWHSTDAVERVPTNSKNVTEAGSSLCCSKALIGGVGAWKICRSMYPLSQKVWCRNFILVADCLNHRLPK